MTSQTCQADNKLVHSPGPFVAKQDEKGVQPEESTPRSNRRFVRTYKVIPDGSPTTRDTSIKADSDNIVVTPKKETVFKVPLAPARPRKSPPIRPPPVKRSSGDKPVPASILTKQKQPAPGKTPEDGKIEDKAIISSEDIGVPESEGNEIGYFEPDGITRDVYVQGSK